MHTYCKESTPATPLALRAPSSLERNILNAILDGTLALDHPPKFLKQILPVDEIALFSDQMRVHYGYLQVPIKATMRLTNEMSSPALGRLFFPQNPTQQPSIVHECDDLRKDIHSCHIHPSGRSLIVQFNSKSKAAKWRGRRVPFLSQPTVLQHYRRPEDPVTALDTEATQRTMSYSFRLLNVPSNIKALQVLTMLQTLEVDILSLEQAQNLGSGEPDVNSFLVVTSGTDIPTPLRRKSRISIGVLNVGLFHFQDYGNMPCRKCAALEHPTERCQGKALQMDKIITMAPDCWGLQPPTDVPGNPTFQVWQQRVRVLTPPRSSSTQTETCAITHEAGTQATMQVEYGTSTELQACDGWTQTMPGTTPATAPHSTRHTTTPISATTWSPEQPEAEPAPASPAPLHSVGCDAFPGWESMDQMSTPRLEQPTPVSPTSTPARQTSYEDLSSMAATTRPHQVNSMSQHMEFSNDNAATPIDDALMDFSDSLDAAPAPRIGEVQSGTGRPEFAQPSEQSTPPQPTEDDDMGNNVASSGHPAGNSLSTAAPGSPHPDCLVTDLTAAEEYCGPHVDYHRRGSALEVLGQRTWELGSVPARGQCCYQALYSARVNMRWSPLSNRSLEIATDLLEFKQTLRAMIQAHSALRELYHSRWLESLVDNSVPSQDTLDGYISTYFARVEQAKPAQSLDPCDWGGFPEIAAASACWDQPVYVLQEQSVALTWWLWRVSYLPGEDQITKLAIHAQAWEAELATFTTDSVLLIHRNGNHFDPLHIRPNPKVPVRSQHGTALPPSTATNGNLPLAPIFLPPQAHQRSRDVKAPQASSKAQLPPAKKASPLARPSSKLPAAYARAITAWLQTKSAEMEETSYGTSIRTVEDIEPFLTDFPHLAREMLWTVGSPELILSRCQPSILLEWGQHMLLSNCYHSIAMAKRLSQEPKMTQALEKWRRTSFEAPTMDEALTLALDASAWQENIPPAQAAIYNPIFHATLSPALLPWLAIVASLLDTEGLEEHDLPGVLTLTELHALATNHNLLDIVARISRGEWSSLWPWGYSYTSPIRMSSPPPPSGSDSFHTAQAARTNTIVYLPTTPSGLGPPNRFPALRIHTQNVDGFRADTSHAWMASWKSHLTHARLDVICLQETHVGSAAQAASLTQAWNRCWGLTTPNKPTAFWSISSSTTGGVAILVHPYSEHTFLQDPAYDVSGRFLLIQTTKFAVASVYAPSFSASARTLFFDDLRQKPRPPLDLVVAGDFNCVSSPLLDRSPRVPARSPRSENLALQRWLESWHLTDSLWQHRPRPRTPSALAHFRAQHHTCHRPQSASTSRLDRLYITPGLRAQVRHHHVSVPGQRSDHDSVTLALAPQARRRGTGRCRLFPIRTAHPKRLQHQILAFLESTATNRAPDAPHNIQWDAFSRRLQEFLRQLQLAEAGPSPPVRPSDNPLPRLVSIAAYKRQVAEIGQYRHGQAMLEGAQPTASFFRRFTSRWDNSAIPPIEAPGNWPSSTSANNMANGWRATLTSAFPTLQDGKDYVHAQHQPLLQGVKGRLQPGQASYLMQPCSLPEVEQALKRLHGGKAPGPDGIPTGFYKAFQSALAPFLQELFTALLQGHPIPSSFVAADILPLKKKGNSSQALDYRPIALLNSVYKIFAQILALRLQPLLPQVIGDQQQGFVPGRTLDDSIGIFQTALASQHTSCTTRLADSPAIICLDIKKAYDSMERAHLLCTLTAMGFPDEYVNLIERIHANTTVQFVVNGERSLEMSQSSGIRQGCPLAPSLFIIGMEPLLAALQAEAGTHGLRVQHGATTLHLVCNAHVDDTAIFLRNLNSLPWALTQLQAFGAMSGLRIQLQKSFGICLNSSHSPTAVQGIPFIAPRERRRYLGIQVGLGDLAEANWAECYRSTTVRMRLASSKTHHPPARALLLRAIVQSKFAFLASYIPPTKAWLSAFDRLVYEFWWHGTTIPTGDKLPTYVPKALLQTSPQKGGWGLPDVRRTAQQQAIRRFIRLASSPGVWAHAIALSSLQLPSGAHYVLHPAANRNPITPLQSTIRQGQVWSSKALALQWPRPPADRTAAVEFLKLARTAVTFTWDKLGQCHCHLPAHLTLLASDLQRVLLSTTSPQWRQLLWHGQLHHHAWIRDHKDRTLLPGRYDTFASAFASLQFGPAWMFIPSRPSDPHHHGQLQGLFLLALSVGLTSQPRLQDPASRVWFPMPPQRVSMHKAPSYDKRLSAHILHTLLPPLPNQDKYERRRRQLCTDVDLPHSPTLWPRSWRDPSMPGHLRWFSYRWHLQAFPFRTSASLPVCPFCGLQDSPSHTFWHCPRAQRLWALVLSRWFAPRPTSPPHHIQAILLGTQMPPAPWLLQSPDWLVRGMSSDHLCHQAWQLVRTLTLRTLWTDRCSALHGKLDALPPPATFLLLLQAHFRALGRYHRLRHHRQRADIYSTLDHLFGPSHETPPHPPYGLTPTYSAGVVFFDGAARMDEGCGGSGAIALHRSTPSLCEYDAHFLADATTNNIAEYDGLVRGLELAIRMAFTHVSVVGDSQLLILQQQGVYRVHHPGLRFLYLRVRDLTSRLHCTWIHRTRDKNQAADFLSKRAPDCARDFGSMGNPRDAMAPRDLALLLDFLDQDLEHHPG